MSVSAKFHRHSEFAAKYRILSGNPASKPPIGADRNAAGGGRGGEPILFCASTGWMPPGKAVGAIEDSFFLQGRAAAST